MTGAAQPATTKPSATELKTVILEVLAQVRAETVSELREEVRSAGGDLEIDSREAEAVIATMENRYGRQLAKVEDLEPEEICSIDALGELISERWDS